MRQYHAHSVEQEVEWLYSFDVHCNAYYCSFLLTHVLQVNQFLAAGMTVLYLIPCLRF